MTTRRAGWVSCNIDLTSVPTEGKVFIVKQGVEIAKEEVVNKIQKNLFLKNLNQEVGF